MKHLRRKLTLRAHGHKVVFVKKAHERLEHVLMKAFLWALYLPDYPDLTVEVGIGDRFKPDVVQTDAWGDPLFWGEAGKVSVEKIESLTRRFPRTHFALAKWAAALDPYAAIVEEATTDVARHAPFDLITFPGDAYDRFVDDRGHIYLTHDALTWRRFGDGAGSSGSNEPRHVR